LFIPNAISLVLDNEKHFFTSFASREKTYTTLFKMWQIALFDKVKKNNKKQKKTKFLYILSFSFLLLSKSIDNDEVNTLVRSFYGEDLGYNSEDDEYEYYMKTKNTKNPANNTAEQQNILKFGKINFSLTHFIYFL
jgi:hypothetical protein